MEVTRDFRDIRDQLGLSCGRRKTRKKLHTLLFNSEICVRAERSRQLVVPILTFYDRRTARNVHLLHASRRRAWAHVSQNIVGVCNRIERLKPKKNIVEKTLSKIFVEIGANARITDLEITRAIPESSAVDHPVIRHLQRTRHHKYRLGCLGQPVPGSAAHRCDDRQTDRDVCDGGWRK